MPIDNKTKKFLKKKYGNTTNYRIWKASNTIFLYDKKTHKRRALNKEIAQHHKPEKIIGGGGEQGKTISKLQIKHQPRKGISLYSSHLFKCRCVVTPNEKYPNKHDTFIKEHHYYYSSRSGIPSTRTARTKHNRDYPHHQLIGLTYILTKEPQLTLEK